MKQIIFTEKAPVFQLPFSQAIKKNNIVFLSGQVGLRPDGVLPDSFEGQLTQILDNITTLVEAAGGTMKDVVKCTAFVTDINDFDKFNGVYRKYFSTEPPARSCFQVAALVSPYLVEMEAIAIVD